MFVDEFFFSIWMKVYLTMTHKQDVNKKSRSLKVVLGMRNVSRNAFLTLDSSAIQARNFADKLRPRFRESLSNICIFTRDLDVFMATNSQCAAVKLFLDTFRGHDAAGSSGTSGSSKTFSDMPNEFSVSNCNPESRLSIPRNRNITG